MYSRLRARPPRCERNSCRIFWTRSSTGRRRRWCRPWSGARPFRRRRARKSESCWPGWRKRRKKMLEFLEGIGSGSVQAFWVPVLVWTGLAGGVCASALAARDRFGRRSRSFLWRPEPAAPSGRLSVSASVSCWPCRRPSWRRSGCRLCGGGKASFLSPVMSAGADPAVISPRAGRSPRPVGSGTGSRRRGCAAGRGDRGGGRVGGDTSHATLCVDLRRLRTIRRTAPRVADSMPLRGAAQASADNWACGDGWSSWKDPRTVPP